MQCGWEGNPADHDECVETVIFNDLLDEKYVGLVHG
jgi:hypothetical protein